MWWTLARDDDCRSRSAGRPSWPSRERRAVLSARRRQRLRWRDGRHGAQHSARYRRAGISSRREDRDAVLHRGLWRHEGAHQLSRRPFRRSLGSQADPRRRLARRRTGAVPPMWAPTWSWVLAANALLGVSQGLTWSTTVIMKIDLVGPRAARAGDGPERIRRLLRCRRSALATGWIAAHDGLRPEPFYLGVLFVAFGLGLSALLVRETKHPTLRWSRALRSASADMPTQREVFWRTTLTDGISRASPRRVL